MSITPKSHELSIFAHGRALVIGVGTYKDSSLNAPVTAREAEQVANALKDPNVAAYPPAQVQLLLDAQATRATIVAALQAVAEQSGPDDTVFIFFSGHGAFGDDGQYYLGTHDVRRAPGKKFQAGTGLRQGDLFILLRAIKAKKLLLVVNACFSGGLGPTLGSDAQTDDFRGAPPPEPLLDQLLGTGEGRAIITASRASQPSRFDWNDTFTFFGKALIEGLEGQGVIGHGGYIGLVELYEHIHARVLEATKYAHPPQEPMLSILRGVGPFPVAYFRSATLEELDASALHLIPGQAMGVRVVESSVKQTLEAGAMGVNIHAGGDVKVDGDVVGGDKVIQGDVVHGNKIVYEDGKKKRTTPRPPFFTRKWLPHMFREEPRQLFLYVLFCLLTLVTLSACSGVPSVEGWKPISEQNLGNAKWLAHIDTTLFAMTETDGKCGTPLDPGLWKSTDQGKTWKSITISLLDFHVGTVCDRSSIEALVASPEQPQRLYAATADVGLLVSPDNGDKWQVLNNDLERKQLSGLEVLADPERLYVVGRVPTIYGLYRSRDGKEWERLDVPDLCKEPGYVSLPPAATVEAFLVSAQGYLYIAPADSLSGPSAEADIYYSGDGGNCWKRVHAPGTQQNYSALAVLPSVPAEILFATWDYTGIGLGRRIWRWQWEDEKERLVADLPLGIQQLYVDSVQGNWYASTTFGMVYRGSIEPSSNPSWLVGPFAVFAAFAPDFEPGRPPLLLRGGRVYRRGTVGWWQGFFP